MSDVTYGGLGGIANGRPVDQEDLFEVMVLETIGGEMKVDDELCGVVWSALANIDWCNPETGERASYSFRAAGDLIAAIIGRGDYLDWYCQTPDGVVSERVLGAFGSKGWVVEDDD